MLYYLFQYLEQFNFPGARMFGYVSFRSLMAVILSLLISAIFGEYFINLLKKKQITETQRDASIDPFNVNKVGVPTMGGIIIIVAILIPCLLLGKLHNIYMILMLVTTLWLGTLGFLDDYIKVFRKDKEGLHGKFKIIGQVGLGLIVGLALYLSPDVVIRENIEIQQDGRVVDVVHKPVDEKSTKTTIPFFKNNNLDYADFVGFLGEHAQDAGWIVFVFITIFVVTAVSNGANLNDGMDGMAAGNSAIIGVTLGILAYVSSHIEYAEYLNIMYIPGSEELVIFICAFIGALVGFLWYNAFPAQVFMGDTGSLTIGGLIAVFAIIIHKELLIPILCGVFLVENLSVILQVKYFQRGKKKGVKQRIFKRSPIHDHFRTTLAQLFVCAGANRIPVEELRAGDIGCTVKLKDVKTGNTLNGKDCDNRFNFIKYPNAKYSRAIKPLNEADVEKMMVVLNRMREEDPTWEIEQSKELKQTIVHGQGEFHLRTLKWRLENNEKLQIKFEEPKIPYRETITKAARADYRHKKQSGGAGQFGEVHLIVEPYYEGMPVPDTYKFNGQEFKINVKGTEEVPLEWGGKLVFINSVVGGAIDTRFMPAILKGIMSRMEQGPLTGSYARDVRVIVYDGKMHPVDSNEISFMLAGRNAFSEAFKNAGPKILEPIYDVEVFVPSDKMGDVMSDLQGRRGMIMGMSSENGYEKLVAKVPLKEMSSYSTSLSSLTGGRASFIMKFASYELVPGDVQDKLMKEFEANENKDE